jgi:hypothetical protein
MKTKRNYPLRAHILVRSVWILWAMKLEARRPRRNRRNWNLRRLCLESTPGVPLSIDSRRGFVRHCRRRTRFLPAGSRRGSSPSLGVQRLVVWRPGLDVPLGVQDHPHVQSATSTHKRQGSSQYKRITHCHRLRTARHPSRHPLRQTCRTGATRDASRPVLGDGEMVVVLEGRGYFCLT